MISKAIRSGTYVSFEDIFTQLLFCLGKIIIFYSPVSLIPERSSVKSFTLSNSLVCRTLFLAV